MCSISHGNIGCPQQERDTFLTKITTSLTILLIKVSFQVTEILIIFFQVNELLRKYTHFYKLTIQFMCLLLSLCTILSSVPFIFLKEIFIPTQMINNFTSDVVCRGRNSRLRTKNSRDNRCNSKIIA